MQDVLAKELYMAIVDVLGRARKEAVDEYKSLINSESRDRPVTIADPTEEIELPKGQEPCLGKRPVMRLNEEKSKKKKATAGKTAKDEPPTDVFLAEECVESLTEGGMYDTYRHIFLGHPDHKFDSKQMSTKLSLAMDMINHITAADTGFKPAYTLMHCKACDTFFTTKFNIAGFHENPKTGKAALTSLGGSYSATTKFQMKSTSTISSVKAKEVIYCKQGRKEEYLQIYEGFKDSQTYYNALTTTITGILGKHNSELVAIEDVCRGENAKVEARIKGEKINMLDGLTTLQMESMVSALKKMTHNNAMQLTDERVETIGEVRKYLTATRNAITEAQNCDIGKEKGPLRLKAVREITKTLDDIVGLSTIPLPRVNSFESTVLGRFDMFIGDMIATTGATSLNEMDAVQIELACSYVKGAMGASRLIDSSPTSWIFFDVFVRHAYDRLDQPRLAGAMPRK